MFGKIATLPVVVVLADLWYGLVLNVLQSLQSPHTATTSLLPTMPDGTFNWLEVGVNASMVLIVSYALAQLLRVHRHLKRPETNSQLSLFEGLGLFLTLAFSLPALYGLLMSLMQILQGHWVVSVGNIRYLLVAVCIAWCATLCLWCLGMIWRQRTINRRKTTV